MQKGKIRLSKKRKRFLMGGLRDEGAKTPLSFRAGCGGRAKTLLSFRVGSGGRALYIKL